MRTEQLLKHINDMGYEYCHIEINKVPVCRITDCNTSTALANKIKKVVATIEPGNYTFVMRPKVKGAESTNVYVPVSIDNEQGTLSAQVIPQPPIDIDKIKAEIRAEIRTEELAKAKEREYHDRITELEEEIRSLKSPMERLAGAGLMLLQNTPLGKTLFSTSNQAAFNLQGTNQQETNTEELTEHDELILDEAENILLKYFTVKEIHAFALKVQEQPGIVNTLKNFNII